MAKNALTRTVLKATGLFTGTQMFGIVCAFVRMKAISLLIGPAGVGLMGVYLTATDMIGNFTQLNIRTSAVRDLAAHPSASVSAVIIRFSWLLGLAGALITGLLAPWLSEFSFADTDHVWQFRLVSVALLLQALASSDQTLMQGFGRMKALAAASMWISAGGLAVSLPFYWFLGESGIVPSVIAYTACGCVAAYVYRRRSVGTVRQMPGGHDLPTASRTWQMGRGFVKVGIFITLGALVNNAVNFSMQAVVERHGEEVLGYYQAGYTMLWRYVLVALTAMGVEFYPRLAAAARSPWRTGVMMSHESIFLTRIMLPLGCVAIGATALLIRVLYRADFAPLAPYFVWGMVGMMFKPLSISYSYGFLASGRGLTYCLTEGVSALVGFAINYYCFERWGFVGLGAGLIAWSAVDLAVMMVGWRCVAGRPLSPHAFGLTLLSVAVMAGCSVAWMAGWWWLPLAVAVPAAVPAVRMIMKLK